MAGESKPWDESKSAAENARRRLPDLVQAYFEQGRRLVAAKAAPEAMHSFRLRTKRLRYTLELFRPFYGPSLDTRLKMIREVQRYLGEVNDCAVSRGIFDRLLPRPSPHKRKLEGLLETRAARSAAAFRDYWLSTFDRAGQDARWRAYLSRKR
jgi:CHAD domain-containing protein